MPFFGGGGQYQIIGTNIRGGNEAIPSVEGVNNIALGNGAQNQNISGNYNISVGKSALASMSGSDNNVVIGVNSATGGATTLPPQPDDWLLECSKCVVIGNDSIITRLILPPPPV
jgi:hypothetical protein